MAFQMLTLKRKFQEAVVMVIFGRARTAQQCVAEIEKDLNGC